MAGRKKIPDSLKTLKGTDQPSRLYGEGIGFGLVMSVSAPEHLNEKANLIFSEVSEMLINQRLLTEADIHLLSVYCISLARYYECENNLETENMYDEKGNINPNIKIQKQLFEQINKIGAQFGMSPTTRIISKAMEQKDEFMKFLDE